MMGRAARQWLGMVAALCALCGALAFAPAEARADTTLTDCTETALRNAVSAGGTVTFACTPGTTTITLTSTLTPATNVTLDASGPGQQITLAGGGASSAFSVMQVNSGVAVALKSLTITNGNTDSFSVGGGIYNGGTLTLTNSTVSSNNASSTGGGIFNEPGATLTLTNSTIGGNGAASFGGGIYYRGALTIGNTIIAANSAPNGADFYYNAGTVTDNGYNLVQSSTYYLFIAEGDITGTSALLGTLGNYEGATQTVPLLPGSPAIDAGSCTPGRVDQWGMSVVGGVCDIGAFESQGFTLAISGAAARSTAVPTPSRHRSR